jgi:hypothetical protein
MQNITDMSLIELKQLAKTKRIKQYYIMKRSELIDLLLMEELPFKYRVEKMTITEMRAIAKQRGMRGFWALSKEDLCSKLFGSHDEKKDHREACEHQDPENKDSNKVRVEVSEDPVEKGSDHMSF